MGVLNRAMMSVYLQRRIYKKETTEIYTLTNDLTNAIESCSDFGVSFYLYATARTKGSQSNLALQVCQLGIIVFFFLTHSSRRTATCCT